MSVLNLRNENESSNLTKILEWNKGRLKFVGSKTSII